MAGLARSRDVPCNTIDEDSRKIELLVQSAKMGNWDQVWAIVGSPDNPVKGYLLNAIPENRRWGVLHQAVYWKKPEVLRKLLRYSEVDIDMRAKQCTSEVGDTGGKNALEIAEAYGYTDVKSILSNHTVHGSSHYIDTFESWKENIESMGLSLIQVSLAAYKATFHPKMIDPRCSVLSILRDIFIEMNTKEDRWKAIRDKVCDAVYVICQDTFDKLNKCKNRHEFYKAIINTYTEEVTYLYTYLNIALRRQRETHYQPTADDLALGPYVVVYQMLLLFWNDLQRENCVTYRKMLLQKKDLDKYKVGTKFAWLSFVSSSAVLANAVPFPTCGPEGDNPIVFTIDNRVPSAWQPRNIEIYACYMEKERVYPAGAQFLVTGRTVHHGETRVALKLI